MCAGSGRKVPSTATERRPGFDVVLIGAPGSGKGTQAEQLAKRFKLPHVATGDLFRENLKEQTPLGQMAKAYMDRGIGAGRYHRCHGGRAALTP